jgi:transposase
VPEKRRSYSPEYRAAAVARVIESSLPVAKVARELGILEGTLGNWVAAYKREHVGEEPKLTLDERARLHEVERELREVRMENEFLKKCASYFAQRQP